MAFFWSHLTMDIKDLATSTNTFACDVMQIHLLSQFTESCCVIAVFIGL